MFDDTTQRILTFVEQAFASGLEPACALEPSSPLFSSRLIDSMGLVELLAFVEREFGVSLNVTVEELVQLDTAANLARDIERLQRIRGSV